MHITPFVKCRCGHVHDVRKITEAEDGKTVTCEQCGKEYQVAVQTMVHLMDTQGKTLKHVIP